MIWDSNVFCRAVFRAGNGMKRTFLYIIPWLFALFACSGPKQIPDGELKAIISESVFTDSYLGNVRENYMRDTVTYLEPILKKYGYTVEDMRYTIRKLSLRKSSVLPVIIQEIADEFESQRKIYQYKSDISKKWDDWALDFSKKILFLDSAEVTTLKELEKLRVTIPMNRSGDYDVYLKYKIDTLDKNRNHLLYYNIFDSVRPYNNFNGSIWLLKDSRIHTSKTKQTVDAWKYNTLTVDFVYFGRNQTKEKPYVTVDTMRIVYYPPIEEARRKFIEHWFYFKLKPDKFVIYESKQKDSSQLYADFRPPYQIPDSLVRR